MIWAWSKLIGSYQRSAVSALESLGEVVLVPRDGEFDIAALAEHPARPAMQRNAVAARGTDGVVGAHVGRQRARRVNRRRHHGPAARR